MSGTHAGGKATAITNIAKYGQDFYKRIGAKGGSTITANTKYKGFGGNRELARTAGAKGGKVSRRGKV